MRHLFVIASHFAQKQGESRTPKLELFMGVLSARIYTAETGGVLAGIQNKNTIQRMTESEPCCVTTEMVLA